MQRIAVIDYGMGNLRSVSKALEHVAPDAEVVVTDDPEIIGNADRVLCPGQGAARDCMAALHEKGLGKVVVDSLHARPFLGICMGYQVLLSSSDENGGIDCLNVLPGRAHRFETPLFDADGQRLKVPHMGWSQVHQVRKHALWQGIANEARFYFAHSYWCEPTSDESVVGRCDYGHEFAVAVSGPGYFACQFHPEKSARDGLQLLANFVAWNGQ